MTTKTFLRLSALTLLFIAAAIGLMCQPSEASASWLVDMALSKAFALAAALALWKLYDRWRTTDEWIARFDKRLED